MSSLPTATQQPQPRRCSLETTRWQQNSQVAAKLPDNRPDAVTQMFCFFYHYPLSVSYSHLINFTMCVELKLSFIVFLFNFFMILFFSACAFPTKTAPFHSVSFFPLLPTPSMQELTM